MSNWMREQFFEDLLVFIEDLDDGLKSFKTNLYKIMQHNDKIYFGFLKNIDESEYDSVMDEHPELPDFWLDIDEILQTFSDVKLHYSDKETVNDLIKGNPEEYKYMSDLATDLVKNKLPIWIDFLAGQ